MILASDQMRQNGQEKVIGNEWKQGIGKILAAWYSWQRLVDDHKNILSLEKEIDDITSQLLTIEDQIKTDRSFLTKFGMMRDQLAERRIMAERSNTAHRRSWDTQESICCLADSQSGSGCLGNTLRKPLMNQTNKLQDELGTARAREQAEGFTTSYTTIQAAQKSVQQRLCALSMIFLSLIPTRSLLFRP